jgi:hypothetical protein
MIKTVFVLMIMSARGNRLTARRPANPALPACGRQVGGVEGHNMYE